MVAARWYCLEQWRTGAARIGIATLLLCFAQISSALEVSNSFVGRTTPVKAGFWWNEAQPGWNLAIHFAGDQMIAVWATYDADAHPVWYMGQGARANGQWTLPLRQHTWNTEDNQYSGSAMIGELTLSFEDAFAGTMQWRLGEDTGSTVISPFSLIDAQTAADRTGLWFDPANAGYGIGTQTQGAWELSMLYIYDAQGQPSWVMGHNGGVAGSGNIALTAFTGACPGCAAEEPVNSEQVGELRRTYMDESKARIAISAGAEQEMNLAWETTEVEFALLSTPTADRKHPAALAAFQGDQALESYLAQGMFNRGCYCSGVDYSPAPISRLEVSNTNLQEAGVDESDVMKSDGHYVYTVMPQHNEAGKHVVRVLELSDGQATEVAQIAFGVAEYVEFGGLFLTGSDAENRPDTLVAMRSGYRGATGDRIWPGPWGWLSSTTELYFFDISDPTQPQQIAEVLLDGGLFTTRRIDNTLYAILRYVPEPDPLADNPGDVDLEKTLPRATINGTDRGPILSSANALLPVQPPGQHPADIVLFVPIDLTDLLATPDALGIVGQTEAVYFSPEAAYLATTKYAYAVDYPIGVISYPMRVETDIHKLAVQATAVDYRGTGTVEGHLGWGFDERSFRLGENNQDLAVVSSSQTMWDDHEHRVTVLRETADLVLEPVSHLPNVSRPDRIGKPGELLYSTRFMGDRLYAVSFRNIDPLYVIDLSDPTDPLIAGELEITGFSEYLHPLPDNLLLGFGKNASPAMVSGDGGTFSWYQGLQLSLFDVADPSNPTIVQRVDIGRRGSDSPLLFDHHAFTVLPADISAGRAVRVAIPVDVHDAATPEGVVDDPSYYYDWQWSGLSMIEVVGGSEPALIRREPLVTHRASDEDQRPWSGAARSLLVEDNAYFINQGEVWVSPWGQGDQARGPN